MIFVTVGNIDPFNRLVKAVDDWARQHPAGSEVLAQIGNGTYLPTACRYVRFLTPVEYSENFSRARLVVGHAGMGTIITALELNKLIVVLPRLQERGELRNQHQLATVRHFRKSNQVLAADSESELGGILDQALASNKGHATSHSPVTASTDWPPDPELISYVTRFVSQPG